MLGQLKRLAELADFFAERKTRHAERVARSYNVLKDADTRRGELLGVDAAAKTESPAV